MENLDRPYELVIDEAMLEWSLPDELLEQKQSTGEENVPSVQSASSESLEDGEVRSTVSGVESAELDTMDTKFGCQTPTSTILESISSADEDDAVLEISTDSNLGVPENIFQRDNQLNQMPESPDDDEMDIEVVDEWQDSTYQTGGSIDFNPREFYHLGEPITQKVKRYGTQGEARQFYLRNLENCPNLYERLGEIFDHAVQQMLQTIPSDALVSAVYYHPNLDEPIYVHFRPMSNINGQTIVEQFERVLQSNKDLNIEDSEAVIRIVSVVSPSGSGYHDKHKFFLHKDFPNRGHGGCFIIIKNNDNLCLARAIVVAIAMLNQNNPDYHWNTIRQGNGGQRSIQTKKAKLLMVKAGLTNHQGPCGITELNMIQNILPEYKIKVFSKEVYCAVIFEGNVTSTKVLHLYHHDKHYDVIKSMPAFFARPYWCEDCNMAYNNKTDHRCINKCSSCYHQPPCMEESISKCDRCNRFFRNENCFRNHLRKYVNKGKNNVKQNSVCDRIQKCKNCHKQTNRAHTSAHKCGYFKCRICNEEVLQDGHLCYMKRIDEEESIIDRDVDINLEYNENYPVETQNFYDDEDGVDCSLDDTTASFISDITAVGTKKNKIKKVHREKEEKVSRFVFFDFETTQERILRKTEWGEELLHVPNLCIAHVICDDCRSHNYDVPCGRCGPKKQIFKGPDCLEEFCRFLFNRKMMHTTAIAHNAKGFDSHFILQYLYNEGIAPKVVTKGLQIISLSVCNIKIIDSFNFLPMALAALPKAFGIEEVAKGYFPHLFNRAENWNYRGTWPEASYYSPSSMKPEGYKKFSEWYIKQIGKTFVFQDELVKYCESDVDVLLKACMKFREIFMSETMVDPFQNSLTIAGACNCVFRKLFLKPQTIGLIPHNGYRAKDKQSAKAVKWLQWMSEKENIRIQHAHNGREVMIGPYKVDGKHGNTVYEFNGCYWHGCPKCMLDRNKPIADGKLSAHEAFQRTMEKKHYLTEQCGFQIIELWECELHQMLKNDVEMRRYFSDIKIYEPLNPRDAFYGGRTNAIKLYHKVKNDERIDYVDVCSLYPYTNKYGIYPVDHPQIITENFKPLSKVSKPYEGLVKCLVLPPNNLYHPVLPVRINGKLLFPLCYTCAKEASTESCKHNEVQRALFGTWVTCELYKALDTGYQVIKVMEVWHYKTISKYDSDNGDNGLFGSYVNTFMKLKMEAEGWPESCCGDDSEKERYIQQVLNHEGIQLDPANIEKNPGKRALAELMLNSFWGKFGQRNNMIKTLYFTEPKDYFELVFDPANIIHSITIISQNLISVTYSQKDDFMDVLPYTNPVIAAYTTAQARLTLYSYIEKLGQRVLYFDTDSIIYLSNSSKNQEYKVPTGHQLGEMTDELQSYGAGSYIREFVSGGPKNYAYKVFSTKDKKHYFSVKVRGITLNKMVCKRVNFRSLKGMVIHYVKKNIKNEINIVSNCIGRKREGN